MVFHAFKDLIHQIHRTCKQHKLVNSQLLDTDVHCQDLRDEGPIEQFLFWDQQITS